MQSNKNKNDSSIKNILRSLKKSTYNNNDTRIKQDSVKRKNLNNDLNVKRDPSFIYRSSSFSSSSSTSSNIDFSTGQEDETKKVAMNNNLKHPFLINSTSSGKDSNDDELIKIANRNRKCNRTNKNENSNEHLIDNKKTKSRKNFPNQSVLIENDAGDDENENDDDNDNNHNYKTERNSHIINSIKNFNYNNNCNKNIKLKCGYEQSSEYELDYFNKNRPEYFNCMSDSVKRKFNRANRIFYNGFLNKEDCSNMPEYQAHAAELLHFLKSLWVTNTMIDLQIVIGNKKYPAHRLALAMFSSKYRDEFQKKLQSSKDASISIINLKNSTNQALQAILNYIYTAKIDINPANVEEILEASKELGIDDLICMASDYLSSLSIGDVLDYMGNMLNKEGSDLMLYELYSYIMTHLDKISRTPEYLKSSVFVVKTILSDSHLKVNSELEVFDAALRWIDYDRSRRSKYVTEIMKSIRFTLILPDEIVSKVENQTILSDNFDVFKMVYNSFKYHSLNNVNTKSKLTTFVKKEELRNSCLKGASVPDDFVKSIIQLSELARKLKQNRNQTTNNIINQDYLEENFNSINNNNSNYFRK